MRTLEHAQTGRAPRGSRKRRAHQSTRRTQPVERPGTRVRAPHEFLPATGNDQRARLPRSHRDHLFGKTCRALSHRTNLPCLLAAQNDRKQVLLQNSGTAGTDGADGRPCLRDQGARPAGTRTETTTRHRSPAEPDRRHMIACYHNADLRQHRRSEPLPPLPRCPTIARFAPAGPRPRTRMPRNRSFHCGPERQEHFRGNRGISFPNGFTHRHLCGQVQFVQAWGIRNQPCARLTWRSGP